MKIPVEMIEYYYTVASKSHMQWQQKKMTENCKYQTVVLFMLFVFVVYLYLFISFLKIQMSTDKTL